MERSFSYVILLAAVFLLVPGCFAEETVTTADANITEVIETSEEAPVAEETPVAETVGEEIVANATYEADINTTALAMIIGETVRVSLAANPTTGYEWNVTNTSGLAIINETYVIDAHSEGMVGVGGVQEWILEAVEAGNQTFSAVYMRSFEEPTGEEDTYTLDVVVE